MKTAIICKPAAKRSAKVNSISPLPVAPAPILDHRKQQLTHVAMYQNSIAAKYWRRIRGIAEDCESPGEPLIASTTNDSELLVHLAKFDSYGTRGGAYAFTVHSEGGFYQSAGRWSHLTRRELEVEGLIETLDALSTTPGRLNIYTAFEAPVDYLNRAIDLWEPQKYTKHKGVRDVDGYWWHLLRDLYRERMLWTGISYVGGESPAIEYCERLAEMHFESGSNTLPDRAAVLESLENE